MQQVVGGENTKQLWLMLMLIGSMNKLWAHVATVSVDNNASIHIHSRGRKQDVTFLLINFRTCNEVRHRHCIISHVVVRGNMDLCSLPKATSVCSFALFGGWGDEMTDVPRHLWEIFMQAFRENTEITLYVSTVDFSLFTYSTLLPVYFCVHRCTGSFTDKVSQFAWWTWEYGIRGNIIW